MKHGWSSARGRARHLLNASLRAYCGAPVRFTALDGFRADTAKRLRSLEVCDHCQNTKRRVK